MKYLIVEEWWEGDIKEYGRCESMVTGYEGFSEDEIEATITNAERYSPYDYLVILHCTSREEYELQLAMLEKNGSTIKRTINK